MNRNLEELFIIQYQAVADADDDADEEALIFIEIQKWIACSSRISEPKEFRSRKVVHRKREEGHERLWQYYFSEDPIYHDSKFRRRFRMRRNLFNRILEGVSAYDDYFLQKPNAANRLGLSPHQKIIAALRMLAYGAAADMWDELLCMGETTILQSVKKICTAIVAVFGEEFARAPTANDLARLMIENNNRGFPGMIGSIDCMHWRWKNCPTAWHGQYTGHKHSPTVILETVASYDTWIWRSFFRMPGSANDLNVLSRSTVFQDIIYDRSPPVMYEINGHQYDMGYYLADGIYPPYATIVKSFKNSHTNKEKAFSKAHESARKDVERAFGILQARFAFIRKPAKFWNKDALLVIIKACIIMHNMIVDDERRDCDWGHQYDHSQPTPEIIRDPTQSFYRIMERDARVRDKEKHQQLREDLVEHIWSFQGANE